MGLDRPSEDLVIAEVVGDAGELARIGEGDGGEGAPVSAEPAGPLLGEVHGVAHGAAVAARQQPAAPGQGRLAALGELSDGLDQGGVGEERVEGGPSLFE